MSNTQDRCVRCKGFVTEECVQRYGQCSECYTKKPETYTPRHVWCFVCMREQVLIQQPTDSPHCADCVGRQVIYPVDTQGAAFSDWRCTQLKYIALEQPNYKLPDPIRLWEELDRRNALDTDRYKDEPYTDDDADEKDACLVTHDTDNIADSRTRVNHLWCAGVSFQAVSNDPDLQLGELLPDEFCRAIDERYTPRVDQAALRAAIRSNLREQCESGHPVVYIQDEIGVMYRGTWCLLRVAIPRCIHKPLAADASFTDLSFPSIASNDEVHAAMRAATHRAIDSMECVAREDLVDDAECEKTVQDAEHYMDCVLHEDPSDNGARFGAVTRSDLGDRNDCDWYRGGDLHRRD